eukprot:gene2781-3218_t
MTGLGVGLRGDVDGLAGGTDLASLSDGRSGADWQRSLQTGVLQTGVLGSQAGGDPGGRVGVAGSGALGGWTLVRAGLLELRPLALLPDSGFEPGCLAWGGGWGKIGVHTEGHHAGGDVVVSSELGYIVSGISGCGL